MVASFWSASLWEQLQDKSVQTQGAKNIINFIPVRKIDIQKRLNIKPMHSVIYSRNNHGSSTNQGVVIISLPNLKDEYPGSAEHCWSVEEKMQPFFLIRVGLTLISQFFHFWNVFLFI